MVIGAGIVGAASAFELLRDGCRVTIVESGEPGGPQAASYGNGAWLSPASLVPMSMPGTWRKVPGYLRDPAGPLTIRWSHLPRLTPWLIRFLRAGSTVAKVERTARVLATILADTSRRHAALAVEIGRPELIKRLGLLYAYPDRRAFEEEALSWRLRRDNGVRCTELSEEEVAQREPSLAGRYRFGVLVEDGAHCIDPGGYVAALVSHAVGLGARIERAEATGFRFDGGRLRAVLTDRTEIACDRAILAAGIGAKELARRAGDKVPLESERGYHVVVPAPPGAPRTPIMPSDGKMANTVTTHGFRAAGQVELASVDAPPDWRRADVLLGHLQRTYPHLDISTPTSRWLGHRPSMPDGLPVIGTSSASSDLVYAFGHGHVGLASGPITGQIAAELAQGKTPTVDVAPFSAGRFRLG